MGLYHTHRPSTLEELAGNEGAVEQIRTHFAQPEARWSHAFMITGPSGCGKTTIARAIAKSVLKAVDTNIREINFANNRGIDTAREIMEQMKFRPATGGKVVYIIDEAHGMTQEAKRAFLKPLEDCPPWVYFFLCTTNYQKLAQGDEGKALNTRCTRWCVEPLSEAVMYRLIRRVCKAEKFENVGDAATSAIVAASNGSPRAALVLLEQVAVLQSEDAQIIAAQKYSTDEPQLKDLCIALGSGNWGSARATLLAMREAEVDPEGIRRGVIGWMSGSLLKNPRAGTSEAIILECFSTPTYDSGFPQLVLSGYQACSQISSQSRRV